MSPADFSIAGDASPVPPLSVPMGGIVTLLPGADPAGAGAHPWDRKTRAEGAGSLVSRAERKDTGVS